MKFYDSHLKKQVDFKPSNEGEANIYLCGPTVYDDAHLGHARSAISFDLLRRVLLALGFKVRFVRNYTDIDDKILHKMSATGASLEQITTQYIASFEADMSALNVLEPDFKPRATEYISAIISYIQMLVKNGFAYEIKDDGIYFDSGRDSKYLSLSARKDENKQARVQNNNLKRDEKDFVLWKFDEKYYDSPFGKGRPGWHSECVAMIREIFGKNSKGDYEIDIHAGGADLLFPHHENEAAQCRCAYNKNLSKYWLHNGFVQINNEKMSKSLGNSFFVKDALKHAPGEALRFYLMAAHYRCNFNYSLDDLSAAKKRLDKIYRLKLRLNGAKPDKVNENFKNEILTALSDDLNISLALASVDEMVNNANAALDNDGKNKILKAQISANLAFVAEIFGILQTDENEWFRWGVSAALKAQITQLINERNLAKTAKNYAKADEIRTRLSELGISIMDTPSGVSWQKD